MIDVLNGPSTPNIIRVRMADLASAQKLITLSKDFPAHTAT